MRGLQCCTAQEGASVRSEVGGFGLTEGFARRPVYRAIKRAFDIGFSAATMIVLMPIFLLIALAIWFGNPHASPLFLQERVSLRGSAFRMVKFRSMYADAEERRADLAVRNEKDGEHLSPPVRLVPEDQTYAVFVRSHEMPPPLCYLMRGRWHPCMAESARLNGRFAI